MAAKDAKVTPAKKPFQQGLEDNSLVDYYDIMVIGRTGMGKSTTVDKLLIAKLPGMEEHPASDSEEAVPYQSPDGKQLICSDLIMWLISDKDSVSARLKSLVFFRCLENSHKEVNSSHQSNQSTDQCELLSNETTKIRILDVPGFFGRDAAGEVQNVVERAKATGENDLGMMRKVLRIKGTYGLNFNRVIYFLPDKGCLTRTSQSLIMEIAIMEKHFGRAIFDNMVVVATMPAEVYRVIKDPDICLFSDEDSMQTKQHLQEAIREIFRGCDDVPEPPIIFISLFDTCEQILEKIQRAPVKYNQIQLEQNQSLCSRCGVTIVREGKQDSNVAYCTGKNQPGAIPDEESTCHPIMVPKHSKVVKILGGIAHLITFRRFVGKWPNFETMEEVCLSCREPPGTRGCEKIGNKFPVDNEDIIVQHTTSVFEPYQVEVVEAHNREAAPDSIYYVYQDGRKQEGGGRCQAIVVQAEAKSVSLEDKKGT